ncbi:ATP-binding cassette domain-containing protein [Kribbella sp. NPDC051770]|uniref:ABC transporter ATP-binding protein n=1 Tax=Kribbella sp. NPDC051770 TaxID=3155413 RepID=UPI00343D51D2
MGVVEVGGLTMRFRAPVRDAGMRAALKAVVRREYREIEAVSEVSFGLAEGEVVGFIGPNGAGKTTTMKILSGILHPTGGEVRVLGFEPWQRRREYLRRIALIRGSQPIGGPAELTVMDSFKYQRVLYGVPRDDTTVDELVDLLDLGELLHRQIRALSLGERMRAGLAMALLYRPQVLFLDEPTLGLDVLAANALRRFVAEYAATTGATILLTSHYMADVETLCRRVILIDKSRIQYDGELKALAATFSPYKLLKVSVAELGSTQWSRYGEVEEEQDGKVVLRVRREEVPSVTGALLAQVPVVDLAVEDPSLDVVMDRFYRDGLPA